MSSARKVYTRKTILLLSDDGSVAEQIEHALSVYCLSNNFQWHKDLQHFQQSLMGAQLQSSVVSHVDLFLIAYVDDARRSLDTLADLRQLKRYALTPSVIFQLKDDREFTRQLYHYGASTVLRYPLNFDALKQLIIVMDSYWFGAVSLPYPETD